jgi:hypothetical protein
MRRGKFLELPAFPSSQRCSRLLFRRHSQKTIFKAFSKSLRSLSDGILPLTGLRSFCKLETTPPRVWVIASRAPELLSRRRDGLHDRLCTYHPELASSWPARLTQVKTDRWRNPHPRPSLPLCPQPPTHPPSARRPAAATSRNSAISYPPLRARCHLPYHRHPIKRGHSLRPAHGHDPDSD